jgi:chitodextrinase
MLRRPAWQRTLLLILGGVLFVAAGSSASARSTGAFEGRFVVRHGDTFGTGIPQFEPFLELDDGTKVQLDFGAGPKPVVAPGQRVRVDGERHGNSVAVAAGGLQKQGGSVAAATTGAKTVAVILFNFSDNPSQPYTPAYANGVAFTNTNSVAAYYAEGSWGKLTLSGSVFGWYSIPSTSAGCNYTQWANDANAAAAAAGVNLSAYTYKVYAFPSASSCGWSGLAYLPGTQSWLNGTGGMSLRVMAHELGHNFSTHHASSLSCTSAGVPVSLSASPANCSASEYGDPFSVMGSSSTRQHTNFSRGNFGWLQAANTLTVNVAGQYTLHPAASYDPTGVQVIRVLRSSGSYFTLEFRQPYGSLFDNFSPGDPAVNGVTIRLAPGYSTLTQSQLVDATPETSSFSDAPLPVGRTVVDPLSGVSITNQGVSSFGANVQIAFASDTSSPTQPGSPTATALDASRIALAWSASSDNVGVAGYRVYRGGNLLTTVSSTSYTDTGLSPATTYSYQVVAVDAAGNTSTAASASATTLALDTVPPSQPGSLLVSPGKRKVSMSWTASSDNVGVAGYRVFRNDVLAATLSASARTYSANGVSPGFQTFGVEAFDAAGNASTRASKTVTVTK